LDFTKHTCTSFQDPFSLKILYCFLIHSNLEYCPLIWINDTVKQNNMLELVQNNFSRFISFKLNIFRSPYGSFDNVLHFLIPTPRNDRRLLLL